MINLTVKAELNGIRLDAFLASEAGNLSRTEATKLCESGTVTVNGKISEKSRKLKSGDVIEYEPPIPEMTEILPVDIPLDIVYEDNELLVVNKQRGLVVHPAPGNHSNTLVNALLYHCSDSLSGINGVIRPGIVHRIDKDTSGLLIVAKTDKAHVGLADQIKKHSFKRVYYAVCRGRFKEVNGTVNSSIGRSPKDRKKQAVGGIGAREAVTHYKLLRQFDQFALVSAQLETGRTHQIRVHMSSIGHPVAGDLIYGGAKNVPSLNGQCLHAALIGFIHPGTGNYMEFFNSPPDYFSSFVNKLKGAE